MDNRTKIGITLSLFLLPTMAFANAGSPMMWFGILHSLILNALIGWTESAILAKFKIPNRTWLIIIGNYVSMFVGLYFIAPHFSDTFGNRDFWGGQTNYGNYQLQGFIAGMTASFIATLIIEFPFFYLAQKDRKQNNLLLKPYIIANATTNAIMFLIYFWINSGGGHW